MPRPTLRVLAAGLAVALASAPAAAQTARPAKPVTAPAATRAPLVLVGPAKARADSARLPYTEADVRFMTHMIGHHAQAIEMSRLVPAREASPAVRTLAERIINAQRDEIAVMQQWLRDRGRPAPDPLQDAAAASGPAASGHAHHGGGTAPAALMPGMLTPAELAALGRARGREFDRRFLQSMIQHHRGATAMVRELFATHGAGQDEAVFKFASDVNVDQTTEIQRMQRMLVELLFQTPDAR